VTDFGDADPDDAFDASDPADEQLAVLARVVADIARNPVDDRARVRTAFVVAALRRLAERLEADW
jgi:hypothetical protein